MPPGPWFQIYASPEGNPGDEVVMDDIAVYAMTEKGVPGTLAETKTAAPINYILEQNYPNPFNPQTSISFTIPKKQTVTLAVFDVLGKKIATLINDEIKTSGGHTVSFDASDLSSGIYFYELHAGEQVLMNKMMVIK